jgi:hypothetical protein
MSNYAFPFPLRSYPYIQQHVINFFKNHNEKNIYAVLMDMPLEIVKMLNDELAEYGLPSASNFLAFKRKEFVSIKDDPTVHVDSNTIELVNASILFPIEGCAGTSMYWLGGEYNLIPKTIKMGAAYMVPEWHSEPVLLDQVEISEVPMVCRVNVLHSALSNIDGSYRTTLSVRLKGNISFENIVKQIKKERHDTTNSKRHV